MSEINPEVSLNKADLDLLYEVSTSIHSIHDLDEMLRNVLSKVRDVFQIEGASIALHDPKLKELYFIRTVEEQSGSAPQQTDEMRFPDDYGVAGWVLRQRQPVLIPDVTKDERFTKQLDIQQKLDTRSMICVPLKSRRGVMGVLYALNKHQAEFSIKEKRVHMTCLNIGPKCSLGSFASWILTPKLDWQMRNPCVTAFVVIQMSIPYRATSVSHTA